MIKTIKVKIQPLKKLKPRLEKAQILAYKFRYLNTKHFQTLLYYKSKDKINRLLNKLAEQKYLRKYETDSFPRTATIYSLGTMGRKYFLAHREIKDINHPLLDRVWDEKGYSLKFQKHCMFLGTVYISLIDLVKSVDGGRGKLKFFTKTDLVGVEHMIYKLPDCYFSIEDRNGNSQGYLLDIIDIYTPRPKLKRRIGQYISYYQRKSWQKYISNTFPEIIFVCPDLTIKNYMQKKIKKMLEIEMEKMPFYLTSWDEIKKNGLNSKTLHLVK